MRTVLILHYFSHMGVCWRSDIIASCMATNGVEMKRMVTHAERSKAISGVAGHILHSFCAGDHGFKGIVGTFLINQFLSFFFTGHSIPWHANENNFLSFFFYKLIFIQHQ